MGAKRCLPYSRYICYVLKRKFLADCNTSELSSESINRDVLKITAVVHLSAKLASMTEALAVASNNAKKTCA